MSIDELNKIIDGADPNALYADCRIKFLDDDSTCDVTIKLTDGSEDDEEDDYIFFYCSGLEDLRALCHYEEGDNDDFVIEEIYKIYRADYDAWELLQTEFDKGVWPKRFPHENERREEYIERIYEEARITFDCMVERVEKALPDIKHHSSLDKDEEWFDSVRDEFIELIVDTISI